MSTSVTPTEFARLFTSVYYQADYERFVSKVLACSPREGDSWQQEKFELFQAAGKALARLSAEHVEAVITYGQHLTKQKP